MGSRAGWYMTDYVPWGNEPPDGPVAEFPRYGGHIWARSRRHAIELAERRGLRERVISQPSKSWPYVLPSKLLNRRPPDPARVMHGVVYLAYLASRAGVLSATDALADQGIVHETIHTILSYQYGDHAFSRRSMIEKLSALEFAVPGYRPPA